MAEANDPIKREKLYNYLSQNKLTDLSLEEFSKEYSSNTEKLGKLHSYLKSKQLTDLDQDSFSKEYFGDLKKKEDVKSTSTNPELVSEAKNTAGSSALSQNTSKETKNPIKLTRNNDYSERREISKDKTSTNFSSKIQNNQEIPEYSPKPLTEKEVLQAKIKKAHINSARQGFKNAVTITDQDKQTIEQRIKDEETVSFWDKTKDVLNTGRNVFHKIATLGMGDNLENPTKIPFQDEIKEVKKEILRTKEELTEDQIKERAKTLFKEKQEDFIYTDKANNYLEELPIETKSVLQLESGAIIDELSFDNKKRMKINSALETSLKDNIDELTRLESEFKGRDITQEEADNYNKIREQVQTTASQINKNYEHLIKNQDDLLSAEKEYDLFKRGYESVALSNIILTGTEQAVGMIDFANYLSNAASEINPVNKYLAKELGIDSGNLIDTKPLRENLAAERENLRKPVESVESVGGFVNYISDLVANQLPILAITSTGYGGLATLGASSAGQKYAEMTDENNDGIKPANYTPLQMIGVPLLHGSAEAIFELPTLTILKKGQRVLKAAAKETPELFTKTALQKSKELGLDFTKENLGEQGTNLIQNGLNIYALGKEGHILDNAVDILKDTSALTSILQVSPHFIGAALKPFQSKDQLKTLEVNAAKMLELSKQLATPNITDTEKQVIESQITKLNSESSNIMSKTIGDVTKMPEELHKEVLKINEEAGVLRKQAQDIYVNGTTANKEELIKTITDQHTALQEKRMAILRGETTIVDTLPLDKQDALKKQALNELTQELNPDGKKDITINNTQITERANEIYLKDKNAKSQETATETKEQAVETATPDTNAETGQEKGVEDVPSPTVELSVENTQESNNGQISEPNSGAEFQESKTFKIEDKETFFHASSQKRNGRLRPSNAPQFGTGVYFSTSKEAVEGEFGKEVTEARLALENPVYTNSKEWNDVGKRAIELADIEYGKNNNLTLDTENDETYFKYDKDDLSEVDEIPSNFISDAAKELGYDAIIDKGSNEYENEIVVLDESKIIYPEDNESTPPNNTNPNADVRPNIEPSVQQGKDNKVQATVEPATSKGTTKIKEYSVSDTANAPKYTVEFKNGTLNVKDSQGKEPSAKTKREILKKHAEDYDFTAGEKYQIPKGATENDVANIDAEIAKTSKNPAELAELALRTKTDSFINDNIDTDALEIIEYIKGNVKRGKRGDKGNDGSYVNESDANNIVNSLARTYLKSNGRGLDVLAQELSDKMGKEITIQDIIDVMEMYPNGVNDVKKEVRDIYSNPAKQRFSELTGFPASDYYLEKAVQKAIEKEKLDLELYNNYLLTLTDAELIALDQSKKDYESTIIESAEGISKPKDTKGSESKPKVQTTPTSQSQKPKDLKSLIKTNREVFGLSRIKATVNAIVTDRLIGTMAKRSGITKAEMYAKIEFRKGDANTFNELSKQGKALYQIVGENALLKNEIKSNLVEARKMEALQQDAKTIYLATGWTKGADGKWKYDLHEGDVSIKEGIGKITDFINYDALFNTYPDAKKIKVRIVNRPNSNLSGSFADDTNTLFINTANGMEEAKLTLLHELQHWVQKKENFARGGNEKTARRALNKSIQLAESKGLKRALLQFKNAISKSKVDSKLVNDKLNELKNLANKDDFAIYKRLAGEIEARNVEARYSMDTKMRQNTPLENTEDIAIEEQVVLFQNAQGAMVAEDGKFIVYALTNPNVSTPLHEMAHVYEHYLNEQERKDILDWAGHKEWTTETSEFFARGFEKYLADGKAPNSTLQKIFDKFKEWLTDIYNGITGSEIDINLSPKMQEIYANMLGVDVVKKDTESKLNAKERIKVANAKIDDIANAIKGIDEIFGVKIKIDDVNGVTKNGVDIVDVIASIAKKAIAAGIEIDVAIQKTIEHLKKTLDFEVDVNDVKAKINEKDNVEPNSKNDSFERKSGKKSLLNRIIEGGNGKDITNALESLGKEYDVRNQQEINLLAEAFINKVGIGEALYAAKNKTIQNSDIRYVVYTEALEQLKNNIDSNENQSNRNELINQFQELSNDFDTQTRDAGQGLSILKFIYNKHENLQFSLSKQINDYKSRDPEGKIPKEIEEKFKELDKKLKDLEKQKIQAEKRAKEAEDKLVIDNIKESINRENKKAQSKKEAAKAIANKLRKAKIHKPSIFSSASPASLVWDGVIELVAKTIEAGGTTADAIQKGLDYIKNSKWYKTLNNNEQSEAINGFKNFIKNETKNPSVSLDDNGKISIPTKIIRDYVKQGIEDIDQIAELILDDLKTEHPDLTLREVRDAITGYGKTINLNQEEIATKIRKMKRLGKLLSMEEDVANGKRPKRSGLQRDKISAEERKRLRELKDLMRDLPKEDVDLKKEWKTALDAVKSRLKNQIEDLQKQIDNKERSKPTRQPIEYDQETKDLQEQRDQLRDELETIVGKPELTDEQKLQNVIKNIENSINVLQEKIDANDIEYKSNPKRVTSKKIEELKEIQKGLKNTLNQMRVDAGLVEKKRLEATKKRVLNQIEDYKRRIREKDFSKRKVNPIKADSELDAIRAEREMIFEEYEKERHRHELSLRTWKEATRDAVLEGFAIGRAIKASLDLGLIGIQLRHFTYGELLRNPLGLARKIIKMFGAIGSQTRTDKARKQLLAHPLHALANKLDIGLTNPDLRDEIREESSSGSLLSFGWNLPMLFLEKIGKTNITEAKRKSIGDTVIDSIKKQYSTMFNVNLEIKPKEKFTIKEQWKNLNLFRDVERGLSTFGNQMRFEEFVRGVERLRNEGKDEINHKEDYEALASYIRTFSGRAKPAGFELNQKGLNLFFFSFKNAASIFQQLNPGFYLYLHSKSADKGFKPNVATRMAMSSMFKTVSMNVASIMFIMTAYNIIKDDDDDEMTIEKDPRSSDFGKLIIGSFRYDPWGGYIPLITLYARLYSEEVKKQDGTIYKMGENYSGIKNRWDAILRFIYNKEAPITAMGHKYLTSTESKDKITGEIFRKTPYGGTLSEDDAYSMIPIFIGSVKDAVKNDYDGVKMFLTAYSILGLGNTQDYGETTLNFKQLKKKFKTDMKNKLLEHNKTK